MTSKHWENGTDDNEIDQGNDERNEDGYEAFTCASVLHCGEGVDDDEGDAKHD